jgi:predicted TIM-barrel fold metal-dependent hydrolase
MSARIDVHQHLLAPDYVRLLHRHGIDQAGGRALPSWSPQAALNVMDELGIATGVVSVSTPGVGFLQGREAAAVAASLNDYSADLVRQHPRRFGFFATLPMPDYRASLAEARRALETLGADGVVALANTRGTYLGEDLPGSKDLFDYLDSRRAVVFVHPADLPGPPAAGMSPFAADFLLDTTRAAYLLVRNGVRRRHPHIRFVLSHGGGMVPYAAHRMAIAIAAETLQRPGSVLQEFSGFWFDTALTASPASLPSLLAFAAPGHVVFGSDWPFAPAQVGRYFSRKLDTYGLQADELRAIHRDNALRLFPRLGNPSTPTPAEPPARHGLGRLFAR